MSIWGSISLMTVIDLAILAMVTVSCVVLLYYRSRLASLGIFRSVVVILVGLIGIALFYLLDLWSMWVLPRSTSMSEAMNFMERLHLDWSWIVTLVAVTCILVGFVGIIRSQVRMLETLTLTLAERDSAEKAREEAELRLMHAQRMEALGTLAGGIAHEFNNLLTPILGYADWLSDSVEIDEEVKSSVEIIRASAVRGREIVKQVLTFSRRGESEAVPTDLRPVVEDGVALARASLWSTVRLHARLEPVEAIAVVDPTQVVQILLNLCTNAAQALPRSEGTIEVTFHITELAAGEVHALDAGRYGMITVRDDGVGIPPEIQARIFDPFFSTKPAGEGTGLGLSVVHGILKAYGGEIEVESSIGSGAEFRVYLPLVEEAAVRRAPAAEAGFSGTGTIMVLDDEPMVGGFAARVLEGMGFDVTLKVEPETALVALLDDSQEFRMLLTDQNMPGLAGIDLIRRLRRRHPGMPVVLMTGHAQGLDPGELATLEVLPLSKPFKKAELERIVGNALGP